MPPNWINFKTLRARLKFEDVLRHYGVEIKARGDQHHGFCPLPGHKSEKRSPSFSAHLVKGIWQCFGCGRKGNVIDFAVHMESLDPEKGEDVRKAATLLQERFCPEIAPAKVDQPKPARPSDSKPEEKKPTTPVVVNAPLDFTLKQLDPNHPYLAERGFSPKTIDHFGLGYCGRGLLAGRIAIPLHDERGQLVGYAGRLVDDTAISAENPRYRLPSKRERNGVMYEFQKSQFLYEGYRIKDPVADLIVVEGFTAVWWLWQSDLPGAVALMGSSCSEKQTELIVRSVRTDGRVWLFPDGDEAGRRCAESLLLQVAPHRFCRWLKLESGKQPTDFAPADLKAMLSK